MDIDVVRSDEHDRFEAHSGDDVVGFIDYVDEGGTLYLTHTEVRLEGAGVGSRLARGTLDQLLASDHDFVVTCPFIRAWVQKHEEYLGRVPLRE